jgi:hypothetical protein
MGWKNTASLAFVEATKVDRSHAREQNRDALSIMGRMQDQSGFQP